MITEVPEDPRGDGRPRPSTEAKRRNPSSTPGIAAGQSPAKSAGNCPARSLADGEEAPPRSQQHRPEET